MFDLLTKIESIGCLKRPQKVRILQQRRLQQRRVQDPHQRQIRKASVCTRSTSVIRQWRLIRAVLAKGRNSQPNLHSSNTTLLCLGLTAVMPLNFILSTGTCGFHYGIQGQTYSFMQRQNVRCLYSNNSERIRTNPHMSVSTRAASAQSVSVREKNTVNLISSDASVHVRRNTRNFDSVTSPGREVERRRQ